MDLSPRRQINNPKPTGNLYSDDHVQGNMSRPTGKSIYMQRKEYAETLNKQSDSLNVRVEHLFTCEMDGRDVDSISDCVSKLKRLDTKGRLWSQEMILDVQGGYLVLSDIETKSELDSLPLNNIIETNAILDTCAYNSLLTLTLQERNKRIPQVYMFQCEETGVSADLDKAIQRGGQGFVEQRTQRPSDQEIFNHVLNDLEIFMSDVTAAQNEAAQNPDKKKRKSKKSKKKGAVHF
uniref:PTB domain-containing protein n=1 Tax=Periophthalmus magnuspinnatus TaxID=409849 RepID=A0A3B4A5K9_9GOBI